MLKTLTYLSLLSALSGCAIPELQRCEECVFESDAGLTVDVFLRPSYDVTLTEYFDAEPAADVGLQDAGQIDVALAAPDVELGAPDVRIVPPDQNIRVSGNGRSFTIGTSNVFEVSDGADCPDGQVLTGLNTKFEQIIGGSVLTSLDLICRTPMRVAGEFALSDESETLLAEIDSIGSVIQNRQQNPCEPGAVTGFNHNTININQTTDTVFVTLAPVCGTFNLNSGRVTAASPPAATSCPANQVVTGLTLEGGLSIREITFTCRELSLGL